MKAQTSRRKSMRGFGHGRWRRGCRFGGNGDGATSCFLRRAGKSFSGRKRSKSSRSASRTDMVMTCLDLPAQSLAKLASSAVHLRGDHHQAKSGRYSGFPNFGVHPASVSFMLPLNASRSPVLSSIIPVFSWKMLWSANRPTMLVTGHGQLHFKKAVGNHPGQQFERLDSALMPGFRGGRVNALHGRNSVPLRLPQLRARLGCTDKQTHSSVAADQSFKAASGGQQGTGAEITRKPVIAVSPPKRRNIKEPNKVAIVRRVFQSPFVSQSSVKSGQLQ